MNDASREFREVKRILSNPAGDEKTDRQKRETERLGLHGSRDKKTNDGDRDRTGNRESESNITGRKTSLDDHSRHNTNARNDDDRKDPKRVRYDSDVRDKEGSKQPPSKLPVEEDYDSQALQEIEQFLAKTSTKPAGSATTSTTAGSVEGTSGKVALGATTASTTTTTASTNKEAVTATGEDEDDSDVLLLFEDEATIAAREALAAEEKRKKRAEIANKYNATATAVPATLASPVKPINTSSAAFDGKAVCYFLHCML